MQEIVQQLLATARGMWSFRWPALIIAWVVAAVGVVIVWKIPNQYEAAARIYVDTDSILKPLMSGLAVQPNVQQQIGMLSRTLVSRPNIEKLIRMADLDLKNQSPNEQEKLVEKLMQTIEIRTAAGGPNLYTLTYRDTEQERAKRVAQAMVSIFIESGLGNTRKDTDSAKTFLAEQIKTYETKLEEAEARLKDFRLRNIDRQGADGRDVATRLQEVAAQYESARLQLREAEQSRDAARRQLSEARGQGGPAGAAGRTLPTVSTPEIDARLEAQRRNLDSLLQRYTDSHPDVVGTRRIIGELEEQKKREVAELQRKAVANRGTGAVNPDEAPAVQELGRMLATAEVQVAALKARAAEFGARYAQLRDSLRTAPQIEAEAAQLNRDYAIIKKSYEDLVARRQSAVMSGELDVASGVAEFRLIDPPRVSPQPVSPNRLLLLPAALVAALAAGLFFAFAAAQLRPTFADADVLRAKTGMPLLGVVSMLTTESDRRAERLGLIRFVSASGGLVGLFIAGLIAMVLLNRYGG